ncbi:MAG: hypothetical protein HY659_13390 [Rhizobiales bacterium]|nr:hypothetical protein [Hyphomicrobiales bacterium]
MPKPVHAIFMYGLGGGPPIGFSGGLDVLASKLRDMDQSVETSLHKFEDHERVFTLAVDQARAGKQVVGMGHSLGANWWTILADRLRQKNIPVPVIVLFDPTWNFTISPIAANVKRAISFYNRSFVSALGKGKIKAGSGFDGFLTNIPLGVLHQDVDDNLIAHNIAVGEVKNLTG